MKLKVYSYACEPHYRLQPNLAWRISKQLTTQLYASFPHGLRLTYPACNLWRMHSNSCPRLGSAPNWVHSARAWATNHHHFFSLSLRLLLPLLPAKNLSTTIFSLFIPELHRSDVEKWSDTSAGQIETPVVSERSPRGHQLMRLFQRNVISPRLSWLLNTALSL